MHVSKVVLLAAYFLTAVIAITASKETYTHQKKLGKGNTFNGQVYNSFSPRLAEKSTYPNDVRRCSVLFI